MLIGTIQGQQIYRFPDDVVRYVGKGNVDCDGSGGNPDHDPFFQPDTTLHYHGKALNAYKVPFVVVPPLVIRKTKGIVMGCRATVLNLVNDYLVECVVGDKGPEAKIGEISCEASRRLGLSPNPNSGGMEEYLLYYTIYPGIPAEVDGITYDLQSA